MGIKLFKFTNRIYEKYIKNILQQTQSIDASNKIFVIGDSHTRAFSFNINFLPLFLGAGKEHNFISEENKNRVQAKVEDIIDKFKPKFVLFYLGEPDTRFYLGQGWYPWEGDESEYRTDVSNEIQESATRYIALLDHLSTKFIKTSFFFLNVTPTSIQKQNQITNKLNSYLKQFSAGKNFYMLSFNDLLYEQPDIIDKKYLGDPIHLNNLIQPIVEKLLMDMNILKKSQSSDQELHWDHKDVMKNYSYNPKFGCYVPKY